MQYRLYGITVDCNTAFPEVPHDSLGPTSVTGPMLSFRCLQDREPETGALHWFHHWIVSEREIWLSFAKKDSGYVLRFPDMADFHIAADLTDVRCYPCHGISQETIRHLFLDQILPILLSQQGKLILHASAVVIPGGAIVFLGESQRGKSTLTASFWQQGFPLLSDDSLLLEENGKGFSGIPSYPGVRLWPDVAGAFMTPDAKASQVAHYTEKVRLCGDERYPFYSGSAPLRAMYVLGSQQEMAEAKDVYIESPSSRDAFMEVVKSAFLLDITDREILRDKFEQFGRVAASVPIFRLAFPRDLALLPTIRNAILEHVDELHRGTSDSQFMLPTSESNQPT